MLSYLSADQTYNEKELLSLVAEGHQMAFSRLVEYYTPLVFRHLLYYTKNASVSEELTQDVFMSIWRNRNKLAEMENFAGYVHIITRNCAHQAFRETVRTNEIPPQDRLQMLLDTPDSAIELKDLANILNKAINSLPPRRREVFKLSRIAGMTYEEIAEKLSISRSSVNQHIIAALIFLRTYLKENAGVILTALLWFSAYC